MAYDTGRRVIITNMDHVKVRGTIALGDFMFHGQSSAYAFTFDFYELVSKLEMLKGNPHTEFYFSLTSS